MLFCEIIFVKKVLFRKCSGKFVFKIIPLKGVEKIYCRFSNLKLLVSYYFKMFYK